MRFFIIMLILQKYKAMVIEKTEFCETLNCETVQAATVCGLRTEENGIRLKLFKNECELMKYGCSVIDELGINVFTYCPY